MNPKILIIEDFATDAFLLAGILKKADLTNLRVEHDGAKGLAAVFSWHPDLIITDLQLPSLPGDEICRLVRASTAHRETPIVVMSVMPEERQTEMGILEMHADAYLGKPFSEEEILGTLRDLFAARENLSDTKIRLRKQKQRIFENHRIIRNLGSGGMGTVYEAVELGLDRRVALKVFLTNSGVSPFARQGAFREAQIMAKLNHPNVVQIYQLGRSQSTTFISMEFVDGGSLIRAAAAGDLKIGNMTQIVRDMSEALDYMHHCGVVHRDIKPGNILITADKRAKVTDFGTSDARLSTDVAELAGDDSHFWGTTGYVAPELMGSGEAATPAADIYALGRTVWRMFAGKCHRDIMMTLKEIDPGLPAELSEAVERCLAPHPDKRYATALDAGYAIAAALGKMDSDRVLKS